MVGGKKHSTVNYVFKYPEEWLISYTNKIYSEMCRRNYNPKRMNMLKALQKRHTDKEIDAILENLQIIKFSKPIYIEHNEQYYQECIENLRKKGVEIK